MARPVAAEVRAAVLAELNRALERDRTYVVVTLIVLGLLCYSLAGA